MSSTEYDIYVGTWVNWSRGRIMGATLTLSNQNANFLIAFIAFIVTIVGTRFWRILCFLVHRFYSNPDAQDALQSMTRHHQRQAILRNSSSSVGGLLNFAQLFWAWRDKSAQQALLITLPALMCAAVCFAGFSVATVFSSRISTGAGNKVLIAGNDCGMIIETVSSVEAEAPVQLQISKALANGMTYAQQCYPSTSNTTISPGVFDCSTFVADQLHFTTNTDAPCPFADGLCRTNTSNLYLDTGLLDSNTHFGLNAPFNDRFLTRLTFQCAPLVTHGYSKNATDDYGNWTKYYYGALKNVTQAGMVYDTDFTYQAPSLASQYSKEPFSLKGWGKEYELINLATFTYNGTVLAEESAFMPLTGLVRSDADLNLLFLSGNGVAQLARFNDEWYRGTIPWRKATGTNSGNDGVIGSTTIYMPEEAASPMGCIQQYQFCYTGRPEDSRCGPLAGVYDAAEGAALAWGLSEDEAFNIISSPLPNVTMESSLGNAFSWFSWAVTTPGWYNAFGTLGSKILVSTETVMEGMQIPLPDNQWQLDMINYWKTYLSTLQMEFMTVATGSYNMDLNELDVAYVYPGNSDQQTLCKSQMIQDTAYTNFSLFGLYFTLVLGLLITLVSFLLETIFQHFEKKQKRRDYALIDWQTSETLQIQRSAFQGFGLGTWSRFRDTIPLTVTSELLDPLMKKTDLEKEPWEKGEKVGVEHTGTASATAATAANASSSDEASPGVAKPSDPPTVDVGLTESGSTNGAASPNMSTMVVTQVSRPPSPQPQSHEMTQVVAQPIIPPGLGSEPDSPIKIKDAGAGNEPAPLPHVQPG